MTREVARARTIGYAFGMSSSLPPPSRDRAERGPSLLASSALLSALALVVAACAHAPREPGAILREAAAAKGSRDARTVALSAFHAYLLQGKAGEAEARLEEAISLDPGEPYALAGQLLMAQREAAPGKALERALTLLERAPTHPLAVVAAREILEHAGQASGLDESLRERLPAALESGRGAGLDGDAAYLVRTALASLEGARGRFEHQAEHLTAAGVPLEWRLAGPLSPYSRLEFDEVTQPEKSGELPATLEGPYGEVPWRQMRFGDGRLDLSGEVTHGDLYLLAVDVEVPAGSEGSGGEPITYLLRTATNVDHRVWLDGAMVLERRGFAKATSLVASRAVALAPGRHRILLKLVRDGRSAPLTLSLSRLDGAPSGLRFLPAEGASEGWGADAPELLDDARTFPDARSLAEVLEPEVGEVLAAYLASWDALGRDPNGARDLVRSLEPTLEGPALTHLRGVLNARARFLPPQIARARATRDLEATNEADPQNVDALLRRLSYALDEGRKEAAQALLAKAEEAAKEEQWPIALARARLEQTLELPTRAAEAARQALAIQPGLCHALKVLYDTAQARRAVGEMDTAARAFLGCDGGVELAARHLRSRGRAADAITLLTQALERVPQSPRIAFTLIDAWVAERRHDEAIALLERLRRSWPLSAYVPERMADVLERAGDLERALALREEALRLDGSRLALRRSVVRARTGKELLEDYAIDAKDAIARHEKAARRPGTSSTMVLDFAVVEAYPDGSYVDRVHVIQRALDREGVKAIAEVQLPAGVEVLSLATIKADGTELEPEQIAGKETVSMPNVEVGDYVAYEYLQSHSSRGPAVPGFTADSFFFQLGGVPNSWVHYTVLAPAGSGLKIDAHNMTVDASRSQDGREVFHHEELAVPPFTPEPGAPPMAGEYLPFVTAGAGSTGQAEMVAKLGDDMIERGRVTDEIALFARQTVAGATGEAAVRALHAAVMERVEGRDTGLSGSAASALAHGRGSRTWLLKASLEAVGIPARIAAVRAFSSDPSPYLFPNPELLPYACLRVTLPDGQEVWLDPMVRGGPFGRLPQQAAGRPAYLMPEPGRPLERIETPAGSHDADQKRVALTLKLGADGSLRGEGEETYVGFDGARLSEALEGMAPERRSQMLQQALARYFGGAELSNLRMEQAEVPGAPLTLRYQIAAPGFGRKEGDRIVLGPLTYPDELGRRYANLGTRKTPLYIPDGDASHTTVTLELPEGASVLGTVPKIENDAPHGSYLRTEEVVDGRLLIEERHRIDMARVTPQEYDAFATFVGEVDLIQARDLVVRLPRAPAQRPAGDEGEADADAPPAPSDATGSR